MVECRLSKDGKAVEFCKNGFMFYDLDKRDMVTIGGMKKTIEHLKRKTWMSPDLIAQSISILKRIVMEAA